MNRASLIARNPSSTNGKLYGNMTIPKATPANDYEKLQNLPTINGKEVIGDITLEELGIRNLSEEDVETSAKETIEDFIAADEDIDEMLDEVFGVKDK